MRPAAMGGDWFHSRAFASIRGSQFRVSPEPVAGPNAEERGPNRIPLARSSASVALLYGTKIGSGPLGQAQGRGRGGASPRRGGRERKPRYSSCVKLLPNRLGLHESRRNKKGGQAHEPESEEDGGVEEDDQRTQGERTITRPAAGADFA